ncbi:MAG: 30S ribosomal protein S11 [Patescibacteria group bacterium]|jgi:small subunit ribosomal protein S11
MSDESQTKNEQTAAAPEEGKKKVAAKPRKKAKAVKQHSQINAHIQATYNNTIVTLTDLSGNVLSWASAGNCGFKGPKKATPYAASIVVRTALEKILESGAKDVSIYVKGVGQGREGAIRAFNANNFNVLIIKDVTPAPHNGCRKPRPRRM